MSRILVVEDEEAISRMIAVNLEYSGYTPVVFGDGKEAADSLMIDHDYDLALLDVMLPGMDGFKLFEVVKSRGIPAIFLTAKDDIASKVTGLKEGAEDYIVKPFEVLELMVRIEKVLERTGAFNDVINICDLEIDLNAMTVKRNGEEIHLKAMEFKLLEVLVRNKNKAISREKLLSMVWGDDYFGETRTVDVHVGQLRKKLGLEDDIKTIHRFGYRLEVKK
ncbi:response regulator transcription factor [Eubacterium ruminantium]|uniref:response regulator transcription factor n=1 Tax=Eubacterium ruminantium TaxID=42322 RepID=UPI0024792A28|nr:response regulator transcription factor [Eubacterium ruminantium]